ncbi:MAG: 30S ribosomal protein S17 [Candidatus Chisholmbacteria bacterium RIFCSPHIGHO2_12_FULL_49_9]|uniref:Small ribosomal subunit protein uS17 n=1 Tax=Candidatus Chisholmbacteria bacterium RIFCSPHIGHO2_01_FULL_52_32 TaxID=1797591 RepID=A0A1G1VTY8_9BACT|nr:MAG: 30S ribosomal protein S17 [Candidatus Chisholmbacteria bacterium RIFCSPHIGHO2_01_FULL_52_32]OGY19227.1 MAG: 30S ribosomal protein S17 [Candidatus Chisholmbacteria bacterium RIFCSPHIGHO2_12_FULL_49_9]OGY19787.1 MAG: 30S ribosomal protein S17 [Candidatus Chisholmbacteria bacterium RIFCSPLOWO2_01_FULL_50_28]
MRVTIGKVTGTKMAKTAKVEVDRSWRHPVYKKIVTKTKTYLAHDEIGVKVGDQVKIAQARPRSKRKRWQIVGKLEQKGRE